MALSKLQRHRVRSLIHLEEAVPDKASEFGDLMKKFVTDYVAQHGRKPSKQEWNKERNKVVATLSKDPKYASWKNELAQKAAARVGARDKDVLNLRATLWGKADKLPTKEKEWVDLFNKVKDPAKLDTAFAQLLKFMRRDAHRALTPHQLKRLKQKMAVGGDALEAYLKKLDTGKSKFLARHASGTLGLSARFWEPTARELAKEKALGIIERNPLWSALGLGAAGLLGYHMIRRAFRKASRGHDTFYDYDPSLQHLPSEVAGHRGMSHHASPASQYHFDNQIYGSQLHHHGGYLR